METIPCDPKSLHINTIDNPRRYVYNTVYSETSQQRTHWGQYKFMLCPLYTEVVLFLEVQIAAWASSEPLKLGTIQNFPDIRYVNTEGVNSVTTFVCLHINKK